MPAEPRLYLYKMTADNGGAPCVKDGVLSLAICKPGIRRHARIGDWVFGFGAKTLGERLIYIARITAKVSGPDYYIDPDFDQRLDCIYCLLPDGTAALRTDAEYHNDPKSPRLTHDVGRHFERAHVLMSDDFRYLGAKGTTAYRTTHPAVGEVVTRCGRGYRFNHEPLARVALLDLAATLWARYPVGSEGKSSDRRRSGLCG